jgi:hypothetical protein
MAFNESLSIVGPYQSCAAGATGSSTESISIPAAGLYSISWDCTVPLVRDGASASGLVVRIRNTTTSTNVFLGTAGLCSGGQVWFSAAANDVIAINLSSTSAADYSPINAVKGQFALSSGV